MSEAIDQIRETLMNAYHNELGDISTREMTYSQRQKKEQLEGALRRALDHAINLSNMDYKKY